MGVGMRRGGGRRGGARRAGRARRRQHQNRARRNRQQRRRGHRHGGGVLFHRGGRPLGHFNFGGRHAGGHRVGHGGFRGRFAVGMMFYGRRGGRGGGASVGNGTGAAGVSGTTTEAQQCTPMAQLIVVMPIALAMFIVGIVLFALNVVWTMGLSLMVIGGGLLALCLIACILQCFDEAEDATSEVDVEAQSRCQSELSVVSSSRSTMSAVTHQQSQAVPMAMLQSTYNQGQGPGAWTTSAAPQAAPGHYPYPQSQTQATDPISSHYQAQNPVTAYYPQGQAPQDPMSSHYQAQDPITAFPPPHAQQQHDESLAPYPPHQAQPSPVPMPSPYPQAPYQPHAQLSSNYDGTQLTETELAPPPAYEDVVKTPST